MRVPRLLTALVVLAAVAGCLQAPGGTGSSHAVTPRDANGTIVYGPRSPGCPYYDRNGTAGEYHYGIPLREHYTVDGVPDDLRLQTFEGFLADRFEWASTVTLVPEKYERIRFRGETIDVRSTYAAERYYHGQTGDGTDLLVVPDGDRTHVYSFEVGDC